MRPRRGWGTVAASTGGASPGEEQIRAAEVIAALSLATDLSIGFDFEHGLRSTLVAARLAERLGVDRDTAVAGLLRVLCYSRSAARPTPTYGRRSLAISAALHGVLHAGVVRVAAGDDGGDGALGGAGGAPLVRAVGIARTVPKAARVMPRVDAACREVARMLIERLGLPASIGALFAHVDERWDGKGAPGGQGRRDPAGDADRPRGARHRCSASLGGPTRGRRRPRAGRAARSIRRSPRRFVDEAADILALDDDASMLGRRRSPASRPRA